MTSDRRPPKDVGPPPPHPSVSAATASALIASQFPALTAPLGDRFDGWDMAMFRLGDALAVRMPRVQAAVGPLLTETRYMAELGPRWPFPHPRVVAQGEPGEGYPFPWTVVTWLPGQTADAVPLDAAAGPEVGRAVAAVHLPAAADAPLNAEQSVSVAAREPLLREALAEWGERRGPDGESLDMAAALTTWEDALSAPAPGAPVWSHADAHGANLLSDAGAFAGIIDWGKMGACDRAVDLAFLVTAMPAAGVRGAWEAYRRATGLDDAGLESRARGIALAKCVSWALLPREANVVMAWRGLAALGLVA